MGASSHAIPACGLTCSSIVDLSPTISCLPTPPVEHVSLSTGILRDRRPTRLHDTLTFSLPMTSTREPRAVRRPDDWPTPHARATSPVTLRPHRPPLPRPREPAGQARAGTWAQRSPGRMRGAAARARGSLSLPAFRWHLKLGFPPGPAAHMRRAAMPAMGR